MIKRHKSFAVKKATPDSESDLGFNLGESDYKCHQEIQGAVILDFISAADSGGAAAGAKVLSFFESALPPEEHARFTEQINSVDEIVDMEVLSEIVAFLIEAYTTRPTKASGSSDAGSSRTGNTSTENTPDED